MVNLIASIVNWVTDLGCSANALPIPTLAIGLRVAVPLGLLTSMASKYRADGMRGPPWRTGIQFLKFGTQDAGYTWTPVCNWKRELLGELRAMKIVRNWFVAETSDSFNGVCIP